MYAAIYVSDTGKRFLFLPMPVSARSDTKVDIPIEDIIPDVVKDTYVLDKSCPEPLIVPRQIQVTHKNGTVYTFPIPFSPADPRWNPLIEELRTNPDFREIEVIGEIIKPVLLNRIVN